MKEKINLNSLWLLLLLFISLSLIVFTIIKGVQKYNLITDSKVTQYTGYLSVTKQNCEDNLCKNSKGLFYWLVPSNKNYQKKPLILWMNGGPGASSLFGFITENGPLMLGKNHHLHKRKYAWSRFANYVIFEQPLGVGLSFADNKDLPKSREEGNEQLYQAISHLMEKYPFLKRNKIYLAGESYGGTYIALLAEKIIEENKHITESSRIDLGGLILVSPWVSPLEQISNDADYAYYHGLIDNKQKKLINKMYEHCRQSIMLHGVSGVSNAQCQIKAKIKKLTQLDLINIGKAPSNDTDLITLVNDRYFRRHIHAKLEGDFQLFSEAIAKNYLSKEMAPVTDSYQDILNKNIRLLIISGLNDGTDCNYLGVNHWLKRLSWPGKADFFKTKTKPIYDSKHRVVIGYLRQDGLITRATYLNAGHLVPTDQPESYFVVRNFIRQ